MRQLRFWSAALVLSALIGLPAQAHAAKPLVTGFSESQFQSGDVGTRDAAFSRAVEARAGLARVNLVWRSITSGVPSQPSDPADPAYDFRGIDNAVQGAAARGLDVMITIHTAPNYAEGPNREASAPAGTWKPAPAAFAAFATAVAQRYSGNFGGLPRVGSYQAWNEENLSNYLSPQYEGGTPFAPSHYVRMLNAFADAVKGVNSANKVVTGGTAPYGDPAGGKRTRPLAFWRDALCLNRDLKATNCPAKAGFDVLAHHPINTSGGPRRSAVDDDDASTPDFKNVAKVLRAAEREGTLATGGKHPLWATEIWWDSNPPDDTEGVPVGLHARYTEEALYLLWKQGASAVINFQVIDSVFDRQDPFAGSTTGLFFADGSPKPAFTAFRFPLVADRMGKKTLIWGKVPVAGKLAIERKKGKGWRSIKKLNVGQGDVFKKKFKLPKRVKVRATVAGEKSLAWPPR